MDEIFIDDDFNNEPKDNYRPWGMDVNQFAVLMHLSQFAFWIIPLGGIILPIVMWSMNKDESITVDKHGKNIINWLISSIIYVIISCILIMVFIGIFLLIAYGFCALIFTIIGAVKAGNGEIYEYPLTIKFLR